MTKFNFLKKCWWSPFLTAALVGGFFFFLLPSVALLALNSRSSMLGLMALGYIGFPWVLSRLHQISLLPATIGFYFVMAMAWSFRPASFDGNYKLALASYLIPWTTVALVANAAISSFVLRKRLKALP